MHDDDDSVACTNDAREKISAGTEITGRDRVCVCVTVFPVRRADGPGPRHAFPFRRPSVTCRFASSGAPCELMNQRPSKQAYNYSYLSCVDNI